MNERIPTEADWRSEPWCLDAETAYKHFHGKTTDEAIALFAANALRYQEDVLFMPSRVLGFYCRAFAAYLLSDASHGDCAGASAFFGLLAFKAEHQPDDLRPLWPELTPLLERLTDPNDYFDAAEYSDFRGELKTLAKFGFQF